MELIALMTKEQFIRLMTAIKDRDCKLEQIYDNISIVFGRVSDEFIENTAMTDIINAIAEIVGDKDDWIWWYIEKGWGKESRLTVVDEYGDEIPSDTLEDLWNLIQSDKGE